jgi:hypothetical protein
MTLSPGNGVSVALPGVATDARFALVTPSYYVDFERCRWLCETVDRYVPKRIPHYLLIDRADRAMFAPLASPRTRILLKEDVLGGRLWQVPFARRWWVGAGRPPVRGWIVQQMTKLLVGRVVDEDVLVYLDSGTFFVRPFEAGAVVRDGLVRLFRESGPYFQSRVVRRWHRVAASLLGVRPVAGYDVGYVTPMVTWRRDNLVKLGDHLERVSGRSAFDCLAGHVTLSEYYLYGMYADMILGDRSGHFHTPVQSNLSYWDHLALNVEQLRKFRAKLEPEHLIVYVDEKSATSIAAVRSAFGS